MRFYFETEDPGQRQVVAITCLINAACVCAFGVLPFIVAGDLAAGIILGDESLGNLMRLSVAAIWFDVLIGVCIAHLQVRERSVTVGMVSLCRLIIALFLNIYFVVVVEIGVLGIVLSTLITSIGFALFMTPLLVKKTGLKYSWFWTKKMLRYALPFIPSTLANRAAHSSDRYFLRYYLSISDVGIYSLGYRLGSVVHNIFNVSLFRILNVRIFAVHKADNAPEIIARLATYSIGVLAFIGLGLSLFGRDIVMIMTPEPYWGASKIIPAIVLCYIIFSFESFAVQPLLISGKTERISYINLAGGAVNIAGNFILIPIFGMYGAVLSTFIAFALKVIGLYVVGRKVFQIPYEWKRLANILLVAGGLFLAGMFCGDVDVYLRTLVNGLLILGFFPVLWICGTFYSSEKIKIAKLVQTGIWGLVKRQLKRG
jgi:O-antigen/teichoic acid export membrane protein